MPQVEAAPLDGGGDQGVGEGKVASGANEILAFSYKRILFEEAALLSCGNCPF